LAHRVERCVSQREVRDEPRVTGARDDAHVDDQRVGRIVRALRRRLGWRQVDLAHAAGCSQTMVSLVERGRLELVPLRVLRRIMAALDATLVLEARWRAGALERLLDADHAALVGQLAELLRRAGWTVEVEVTYSEYGERGSYDILAFHTEAGAVLVVEVKTDLASVEGTLRKVDEKSRLAAKVAGERFGWPVRAVSRLLVMPELSTLRRRVARHEHIFGRAFPGRGAEVRRWLRDPDGRLAGLWFLSPSRGATHVKRLGGRERVRRPSPPSASGQAAA
jgi:transcriptional regulator with XRE-family HTH domain